MVNEPSIGWGRRWAVDHVNQKQKTEGADMADLIVAAIVFFILFAIAYSILKFIAENIGKIIANILSTAFVVGGVVFGFSLLFGQEANAAMAIAVPASLTVAKMQLSTGGF